MCRKFDTYTRVWLKKQKKKKSADEGSEKESSGTTCTARGGRVLLQILELLLNPLRRHLPTSSRSYFQQIKIKEITLQALAIKS